MYFLFFSLIITLFYTRFNVCFVLNNIWEYIETNYNKALLSAVLFMFISQLK